MVPFCSTVHALLAKADKWGFRRWAITEIANASRRALNRGTRTRLDAANQNQMNNIKDFRGTFWTNSVWLWQAFLARKSKFLKQVNKMTFLHACSLWFFQKILHRNPTWIELFIIHVCFKIDTTYTAEIVPQRLLCWSSLTVKLFPRCFAYHNKPSSIFDSGQFNGNRFPEWIGFRCDDT